MKRTSRAALILAFLIGLLQTGCHGDRLKKLKEDPSVLGIVGRFFFTREDLDKTFAFTQLADDKDTSVQSRLLDGLVNDLLVLSDGAPEVDPSPAPLGPNGDPKARGEKVSSLLNQKLYGKITVSDAEVEAYYKAHIQDFTLGPGILLREMLLGGEKQAREADKMLRHGEPFADVAKLYSISPDDFKARYFEFKELPEYLQPQLANLEAGRLTRPIAVSPDLFQIIMVLQRSESYTPPLEEVSDQIRLKISDSKGSEAYKAYLDDLGRRFPVQLFWSKLSFRYVKEAP